MKKLVLKKSTVQLLQSERISGGGDSLGSYIVCTATCSGRHTCSGTIYSPVNN